MEKVRYLPHSESKLVEISVVQRHVYTRQTENLGGGDACVPYTQEWETEESEESIRIVKASEL